MIVMVNQMVYNVSSKWLIRIGQTPQNFGKKLKSVTVSLDEMKQIADVLDVTYEQLFTLPDGEYIKTTNE